ncbi:hypothetical protein [Mariniluteicoccus flavus]
MDVVVNYTPVRGGAHRIVGALVLAVGLLMVVASIVAIVSGAHVGLIFDQLGHATYYIWLVLGAIIALVGALVAAGVLASGTKLKAPNGVAWVLQPGGVLLFDGPREVRIPWREVRFDRGTLGGKPSVICGNGRVRREYPERGLSLTLDQHDAEARRLSAGR